MKGDPVVIVDLSKRWQCEEMPCLRRNPEMFFFSNGKETLAHPSAKVQAQWDRAKEVCYTCPVMRECGRDNLGEVEGVWGGMDPAQRIKLRFKHSENVHKLTGPVKVRYAQLAYMLREDRNLPFSEIARIIGIRNQTAMYLWNWYKSWLDEQRKAAAVRDLELPEPGTVTDISPNAAFPENPPAEGDAWVRYGRRVVFGYYLGQTEDDAWISLKVKLLGPEYSVGWFKAEDVKMTRKTARNVLTRVGKGSRIYGTALSRRGTAEAG